jgi:hypothetical protein
LHFYLSLRKPNVYSGLNGNFLSGSFLEMRDASDVTFIYFHDGYEDRFMVAV